MSDPLDYATPQHAPRGSRWSWVVIAIVIVTLLLLLSGFFWTATTVTPLPRPTAAPTTRIG